MSVIYLYGFVPADVGLPEQGLLGVQDTEVERVDGPGFAAVVSRVAESEFAGDALDRNCGDVEWMAALGLSHEQVVSWFVDHATILPARLLTLFSGPDALASTMDGDADRVQHELERFAGLHEWDLRVGSDTDRLMTHLGEVSEAVGRLDREIETATPGKRFLLEKKRKDVARTEGRGAARRLARELLDALRPLARDVVTLDPPADGAPASLNAALLVERAREAELNAELGRQLERVGPLGITAELSGPWAPYRFLQGDDD